MDQQERTKDLRAEVIDLVRTKNYDRALEVLFVLRALVPDDLQVSASIQQIKSFLVTRLARQLGGLDSVAPPIPASAARTPEALVVARLVDGIATIDDLCRASPFGQLQTLKILHALYRSALSATRDYHELGEDLPQPTPSTIAMSAIPAPDAERPSAAPAPAPTRAPSEPTAAQESGFDFNATFQRGLSAYIQRRYDEAREAVEQCLREQPLNRQVETMLQRVRAESERDK
jgi:hypothetical protein